MGERTTGGVCWLPADPWPGSPPTRHRNSPAARSPRPDPGNARDGEGARRFARAGAIRAADTSAAAHPATPAKPGPAARTLSGLLRRVGRGGGGSPGPADQCDSLRLATREDEIHGRRRCRAPRRPRARMGHWPRRLGHGWRTRRAPIAADVERIHVEAWRGEFVHPADMRRIATRQRDVEGTARRECRAVHEQYDVPAEDFGSATAGCLLCRCSWMPGSDAGTLKSSVAGVPSAASAGALASAASSSKLLTTTLDIVQMLPGS